jgi:hypothetical protein
MNYKNGKIYKLQHEDGHFYYGSTTGTLAERTRKHKVKSIAHPDRRVYKHINGEWDKVKAVLVEHFPCESKAQLNKKEDEFIQRELQNLLCLNMCRASGTDLPAIQKKSHDKHKEARNAASLAYNAANKERIAEKRKADRNHINTMRRELRAKKKFEAGEAFAPRGAYAKKNLATS